MYVPAVKAFWKKLDVDKSTDAVLDAIDKVVTSDDTEPDNDKWFVTVKLLATLADESVMMYIVSSEPVIARYWSCVKVTMCLIAADEDAIAG